VPNLARFILKPKFQFITIVCHPNADPDCIGSAYAVSSALGSIHPGCEVTFYAPEGISTSSKKLGDYLHFSAFSELPPRTDLFILVDTSSVEQAPAVKEAVEKKGVPYAMLDHHFPDPSTLKNSSFKIVRERSSACEVVFEAFGKKHFSSKALEGLLVGLMYDSRRFLTLPERSIQSASKMIKLGADAQLALQMLTPAEDPSEKIAKLKGVSRAKLYKMDEWIIAITYIGSFEATVARSLTNLGADLSLVVNDKGDLLRLSGRASDNFHKLTGLHLAKDVMQPLAQRYGGQGGGHPTAASVSLPRSSDEIIQAALDLITSSLFLKPQDVKEITSKNG
jgi:nanoRNase/pAp phosphatase (c-di-AMP/oligoRNAs hydrolase)